MCLPSPVASKCWHDFSAFYGSRVTYLGIVGDQAHAVRISGHNCGSMQESALVNPFTGALTQYPDAYAHALDIGHGGDRALATEIRNKLLNDPFKRVRYVIDNGVVYYPAWRGGGTSPGSGHTTHVHVSFTPWATHDVRSFLEKPKPIFPLKKGSTGFAVLLLEIVLVHCGRAEVVVDGRFGPKTETAVRQMQKFLKRRVTGKVTEGDFEAFVNWANLTRPPSVYTLNDRGPQIAGLRKNLHKIGQDVPPRGNVYDAKVQTAMQNVQRFFKAEHRAGNATKEDRAFVRLLADES